MTEKKMNGDDACGEQITETDGGVVGGGGKDGQDVDDGSLRWDSVDKLRRDTSVCASPVT